MNEIYIIKNCPGYGGSRTRYYQNFKIYNRELPKLKKQYKLYSFKNPMTVWFSDKNTPLKKIYQYP